MPKRNWKKVRPNSLRDAMELCLHYAREKRNLSVDRIADLMGLPSKWSLYKWLENGRMPMVLIRAFEHACGADYITQYLASSAQRLLIDIPSGKPAGELQISELQGAFSEAMGHLIRFYKGDAQSGETLDALQHVLGALAWQRENVAKHEAPELALFDGDEE